MAGQRGLSTPIMDINSIVPNKDEKEKPSLFIEVASAEKQLWALILTNGVLHFDVQAFYQRVCFCYEKIILNDQEVAGLQEVEYSLWKVHYWHIDEFRKRMKKKLTNGEAAKTVALQNVVAGKRSNEDYVEGFKSFLLEAITFYQNLIRKVKTYYELPEDFSLCRKGGNSVSVEPEKMQKLQFLCHRFLVCLGDLARYREQCERSDIQNHNWSVAAINYLEATQIWPHSGNPQNQLAVLAMYVGDEFLALYHCIRSLAVREPFPDAWNNLILLFERNRSSHLHSFSKEAHFDFLNPSESVVQNTTSLTNDPSNCKIEHEGSGETHFWPLFIRMTSFFYIKSSLEDFPFTFASTIKELDVLMSLYDTKLKLAMEAYQCMDSAKSGPFRSLQVVSILVFAIENLINSPEARDSKNKNDTQHLELTRDALAATFIFMERLVGRCLKANILDSCPLLPALLVFLEWLVSILDEAEIYGSNEKCTSAMAYFFVTFLELLKRFDINICDVKPPGSIALWEDYELQGFAPLACFHTSLDFSTHWEYADSYECGTEIRAHRIINAAIKIAERLSNNRKWIFYDKSGRKFYTSESNKFPCNKEAEKVESPRNVFGVKESSQHVQKITEESEKTKEKPSESDMISKSVSMEEEEVILFKPLTRHNSAPLYSVITAKDQVTREDTVDQIVPADECLRRATSMLIAQNQAQGYPSAFQSDLTNFRRNKPLQQQESLVKDVAAQRFSEPSLTPEPPCFSTSISSGPPSLNAWFLNQGSLSNDRAKGKRDRSKPSMPPIEEIASTSLNDLSIGDAENSASSSRHEYVTIHNSSRAYSAPLPSAPFLPDDAIWFSGIQSTFSDPNGLGNINRTNSFFDESQASGYSNWTGPHQPLDYGVVIPGFTDGYPPLRCMTSSEWLCQYRENQNLERTPSHAWLAHPFAAASPANFYGHDMPRSGLFDQFGAPLATNPLIYEEKQPSHSGFPPAYSTVDHRREKLHHGYQRPSPYGCAAVNEPEPLLHYLKEKEWLLHQDPTLRGPTYMGS